MRELPEGTASGRVVETEAHIVGDAVGHAYWGMTRRNRLLFLERGHAYIYLAYDISYMLNVSSEIPGIGAGVLIKTLEPLEGIPITQLNRGIELLRNLLGRLTPSLRGAPSASPRSGSWTYLPVPPSPTNRTIPTCSHSESSASIMPHFIQLPQPELEHRIRRLTTLHRVREFTFPTPSTRSLQTSEFEFPLF